MITIIILDKLAFAIATEEGKTLKDAYNEVQRGPGEYLVVFHVDVRLALLRSFEIWIRDICMIK